MNKLSAKIDFILQRTKSKISFTVEAFPLLTVNYYNLIHYVSVKQAWLYNVQGFW